MRLRGFLMDGDRRTTIKDVAAAAGVSTAAVSQALRPREGSNIKLQERKAEHIRATARRLRYMPHAGARSIRSRRFGTVGYLSAKSLNLVYRPYGYQQGVHDALEGHDYRTTLLRVSDQFDEAKQQIPNAFRELNLDALIVESYSELGSKIYNLYSDKNLPLLYLNDRNEWNSVYVDDITGAEILTRHAIERGHRRICLVHREIIGAAVVAKMHHSAADREKGFVNAMEACGLTPSVFTFQAKSVLGRDIDLGDEHIRHLAGYDAVIAYDDDLANMIARGCYRNNIRIPQDLALAGFNGDYASMSSWCNLTTMQIPAYEMGLQIGKMAVQRLTSGIGRGVPSVSFVPTLVRGDTL